jgi:hypothetical protein
MKFTWWGGVLGPKILSHVKCPGCGFGYNGKSGRENTVGIAIYCVVVAAVVMAFFVVLVAAFVLIAAMN